MKELFDKKIINAISDGSSNNISELYIDPSYQSTGLFSLQVCKGKTHYDFSCIVTKNGPLKVYRNYFNAALFIKASLLKYIDNFKFNTVYIESPPPTMQASAGLWGLSFMLVDLLLSRGFNVKTIEPSYLSIYTKKHYNIIGKRSAKRKKERIELAKKLLQEDINLYKENISVNGIDFLYSNEDTTSAYLFHKIKPLFKKELVSI